MVLLFSYFTPKEFGPHCICTHCVAEQPRSVLKSFDTATAVTGVFTAGDAGVGCEGALRTHTSPAHVMTDLNTVFT